MSTTTTGPLPAAPKPAASAGVRAAGRQLLRRFLAALRKQLWPTAKYLTETEVHTYAFSVAANAILSFFPFCVMLLTIIRHVFHSKVLVKEMSDAVAQLLSAFLPANQEFITNRISELANAHSGVQVLSLIMLLVTSTGVFLPLEVALNRVWGMPRNRSYLGNQIISLMLAAACGVLALFSAALTATNARLLGFMFRSDGTTLFGAAVVLTKTVITVIVVKILSVAATTAIFFLIYWRLPNGKVKARSVLPAAIVTGILWEIGKYLYTLALPWLDFQGTYGPFYVSVTLIFWAFLSGLLLLAGARLSASLRIEEIMPETSAATAASS